MLQLIGVARSPFVWKLRVILVEKGLAYTLVDEYPSATNDAIIKYNPLGKIPVLLTETQQVLCESKFIAQYLTSFTGGINLVPTEMNQVIEAQQVEVVADGICDAMIAIIYEQRRDEKLQCADAVQLQFEKILRGVSFLNTQIDAKSWMVGDHFSIADIASVTAYTWLKSRYEDYAWQAEFTSLDAHASKILVRESMQVTHPFLANS
ncbi:glutathione S-transferase N-terminal domain-containing protein [Shewanella sp.]|uniref:glutathione S-transferase N-terminal domain-containing protein n=1 Tax=Shewanella sp. TaxID=50422 RepID=UPI0025CF1D1F|nr:glutathione S-transferase N-terminal domain-containing protein [Shewanella sp.]